MQLRTKDHNRAARTDEDDTFASLVRQVPYVFLYAARTAIKKCFMWVPRVARAQGRVSEGNRGLWRFVVGISIYGTLYCTFRPPLHHFSEEKFIFCEKLMFPSARTGTNSHQSATAHLYKKKVTKWRLCPSCFSISFAPAVVGDKIKHCNGWLMTLFSNVANPCFANWRMSLMTEEELQQERWFLEERSAASVQKCYRKGGAG